MHNKLKIRRGPYLECWVVSPQKTAPEIIIPYGIGRSTLCSNYDEAHALAERFIRVREMEKALVAVNQYINGEREDFETVDKLLQNAFSHEKKDR